MKIVIATGIYPPEIGGPAEYAKNLENIWRSEEYQVETHVFSRLNNLPTGIRHLFYFFEILNDVAQADFVLILDTFSAALPAVLAAKILGKKTILRTGGDFLWEMYVERTGDLVVLRDFYINRMERLSFKEKLVFKLTRYILKNVSAIIWSTEWQKNIFINPYELKSQNNFVVENYYGRHQESNSFKQKNFLAFTRKLKWKHIDFLKKVFDKQEIINSGAVLDTGQSTRSNFIENLKNSYAVIVASLGDISPNTILDAIVYGKPFILTRETGIYDRVKDIALWVDPLDPDDVAEKVIWLCNPENYRIQTEKVKNFNFYHSWEDITQEYVEVYNKIK